MKRSSPPLSLTPFPPILSEGCPSEDPTTSQWLMGFIALCGKAAECEKRNVIIVTCLEAWHGTRWWRTPVLTLLLSLSAWLNHHVCSSIWLYWLHIYVRWRVWDYAIRWVCVFVDRSAIWRVHRDKMQRSRSFPGLSTALSILSVLNTVAGRHKSSKLHLFVWIACLFTGLHGSLDHWTWASLKGLMGWTHGEADARKGSCGGWTQ